MLSADVVEPDVSCVLTLLQSASDFCVSPDTYITRVTKENAVINQGKQGFLELCIITTSYEYKLKMCILRSRGIFSSQNILVAIKQ